jgi:hypothetical protein
MAVERRLDRVESALSGRDRARLAVQAASNGEEPDERLDRYCPASERGQFEAITKAVTKGITETWQRVLFEIEWLNNDDVSLGWLECIAAFLAREKALKKLAGAQAKSLPPLPPPGRGFLRDVPLLWGVLLDPPEHGPATWEEAVTFLTGELRRGVEIRWRSLRAYEDSLAMASAALGVTIAHPDLTKAMEAIRTKVLDLHAALQRFERFDLPEPEERERETVRGFWDMEVLREKGDGRSSERSSMWQSKREELEAWEQEQAEKLREST